MAFLHRNKRWRGLSWAIAIATLQCLQTGQGAAVDNNEPLEFQAESMQRNFDTATMTKPVVTQGRTLLKALNGEGVIRDGDYNNSTWKFTGNVHLELDGAVLDAQAATAVFAKGLLVSVVVQSSAPQLPKKLVHVTFKTAVLDVENANVALAGGRIKTIVATGTPTQFSYELTKQVQKFTGRANKIEYDAEKDSIQFSGDTWYTDGRNESTVSRLVYNFTTELGEAFELKLTSPPRADRVPQIRTPDRATAK
jgi:lipopolysaccharide transport protein LptA